MEKTWVMILVFLGVAAFIAGCGGSDSNRGYVDPYKQETGGRSPAAATPPVSSGTGSAPSPKAPVGDATGGGEYGERIIKGSGQEGVGGTMDESSYREWAAVGKAHSDAVKLYRQYFTSKESSGQVDTATLDRAIAMYEQILPRAEALLDKYEGNTEVESQYQEIINDLRALKDEKN